MWRDKNYGGLPPAYSNCRSYGRVTIWEVCFIHAGTLWTKKTPTWHLPGLPGCQHLRPFLDGQSSCELSASLIFRKPCFVETNKLGQRRAQIGKFHFVLSTSTVPQKVCCTVPSRVETQPLWTSIYEISTVTNEASNYQLGTPRIYFCWFQWRCNHWTYISSSLKA